MITPATARRPDPNPLERVSPPDCGATSREGEEVLDASCDDARAEPFASAVGHLLDLVSHVRTLLRVRAERRRLRVRRWILLGAVGVLGLVALVPLIVAGVSLLAIGVAQGFAVLCAGEVWLGNLLGGLTILGAVALLVWAIWSHVSRESYRKKVAQYGNLSVDDDPIARETPAAHGGGVAR